MSKYEFVHSDTIVIGGRDKITLTRIRALRGISRHGVKAGDLGGYLESGENLSQEGDCWVGGDARVYDYQPRCLSRITDSALITGTSEVYGSRILENAIVTGDSRIVFSQVFGNSRVSGKSRVKHDSFVFGNAHVTDNGSVYSSTVAGDAVVSGKGDVYKAMVTGDAVISGVEKVEKKTVVGKNNSNDRSIGYGVVAGIIAFCFMPSFVGFIASVFVAWAVAAMAKNS